MKIAWIGTGVMGAPMACHLADAGHEVFAYNRTYAKAKALEPKVRAVESIEACVEDADFVFSIVGYPKDVDMVISEVLKHVKKEAIIIDMTTSSPGLALSLAQKGEEQGITILDAPVTGGDLGARNASLSIMVGGPKEAYEKVYPLLALMGKTITYMGKSGSGQHAKLANQTAIAGALAGISEALSYAKYHELDLDAMLQVITGGSASSWQAINNGPKMIKHDYAPGFFVKHFLKDLRLILEEKGALNLPVTSQVEAIFASLSEEGCDDEGTQAIIKYYEVDPS